MNAGPILRAMKQNRTRVALIILEIAMTLAIVTNCVNVIIAERAKINRPSGFDDANILRLGARPFSPEFREEGAIDKIISADLRTLRAVPGVKAVANTHFRLWEGGGSSTQVKPLGTSLTPRSTQIYYATTDIFNTLGVHIVEGRGFVEGDDAQPDRPHVVVISRTVANELFPDGHAVGKPLTEARDDGTPLREPYTIVGVFDTFFNPFGMNPEEGSGRAERAIFLPSLVGSYNRGVSYLIRCEPGAMASVMAEAERRMLAANAGRIIEFEATPEKKARWFAAERLTVLVMTGLIVALIFVTGLGILGITALSVSERTKQIGTRRALGATRSDILRHFLMENWLTTTAGIVIGIAGAYALNFLLVAKVTDVKMPWQLVAMGVVLLWINGLLATLPPALRATHVPPSIATRSV
jgi:putative ABC transport system permease protein